MQKIIRVTTVPVSLGGLLEGQLKFMSQYYEVVGISSQEGTRLQEVADAEEVRVIPVEMTRKITPIKDLKAVYQLYKIFKAEKPQIVHSHTPKAGTLSMMAAFFARVPHRLHTIAGLPLLEVKGPKRILLDIVEKFTYGFATMIYPNSFGLKQIILDLKYTKERKLKVIANGSSNGIDTSHFNPSLYSINNTFALKKELGISSEDLVFVFVGRIVKDKGINELISAFKTLNESYKQIKLLLVGSYEKELDPVLPETEQEISENPNIISVGWQTDVRPYFAVSDVLAFPSYREGFPNVVMQAAAMGITSIVTDINGCNEIISDGVNGLIIPPKDEEQLRLQMKALIEDKDLVDRLSKEARTMICELYERKQVWKALLQEYRALQGELE